MHQRKMSKMTKYLPYSMYLKEYMTLKRDVFFNLVTTVQQGKILGQLGSSTSTYQLTCFFTLTSTNKFSQLANRDKYGRKIRDLHYWSDFGTSRNIKLFSSFGIKFFNNGMAFGGQNVAGVNECQPACQ